MWIGLWSILGPAGITQGEEMLYHSHAEGREGRRQCTLILSLEKRFQHRVGFPSRTVTLECPLLVQGRAGMKLHTEEPASVRSQKRSFFMHVGLHSWQVVPQSARTNSWGCAHLFSLLLLEGWTHPIALCSTKWPWPGCGAAPGAGCPTACTDQGLCVPC